MPVSNHYLRRLPDREQVLVPLDAELYRDVMFPLASVNLRRVNPLWSGWVSWIYTFEDPSQKIKTEGKRISDSLKRAKLSPPILRTRPSSTTRFA